MKTSLIGAKRVLPGFSIMEMMIAMALFAMIMLIVAQTYVSFNGLHRKIANRSVLSQDLRFTMELLVRAARNRPISYVTPPAARASELRLMQTNGVEMIFRKTVAGDAVCADIPTVACLVLSTDGGTTWVPLTGKRINVEQFDVYVRPSVSPFNLVGPSYPNNTQPFVTFNIRERYMAESVKEREVLQSQTTVSSRVYLR
jgi:prepilin-type N-terminal cleavage/methylation domain-containing protein